MLSQGSFPMQQDASMLLCSSKLTSSLICPRCCFDGGLRYVARTQTASSTGTRKLCCHNQSDDAARRAMSTCKTCLLAKLANHAASEHLDRLSLTLQPGTAV